MSIGFESSGVPGPNVSVDAAIKTESTRENIEHIHLCGKSMEFWSYGVSVFASHNVCPFVR